MPNGNVNWEKNIADAMSEIDGNNAKRHAVSGISLPSWLPYIACIALGVLVADLMINERTMHSVNNDRDYATGGSAAILMVAEDVQSYWDAYGDLPEQAPGSLAQVLNVSYEKLGDAHFQLSMPHGNGAIVFDGSEDTLVMN
jgi:hypothetical protein